MRFYSFFAEIQGKFKEFWNYFQNSRRFLRSFKEVQEIQGVSRNSRSFKEFKEFKEIQGASRNSRSFKEFKELQGIQGV